MPTFDYLTYVQYHIWANNRLLDVAEKIPTDQLMNEAALSFGSAFKTLRHMLDVEWSWRMAAQGQAATTVLWELEPLEDLAAVRAYWGAEGERLLDFVRGLSDAEFEHEVTPSWMQKPYAVKHILIHLVNHATNHRTELGWHFTRLGHSLGDSEFIDYLNARQT
ncbi:MAG: DinB family protein [Chloroflexota bacterium]